MTITNNVGFTIVETGKKKIDNVDFGRSLNLNPDVLHTLWRYIPDEKKNKRKETKKITKKGGKRNSCRVDRGVNETKINDYTEHKKVLNKQTSQRKKYRAKHKTITETITK